MSITRLFAAALVLLLLNTPAFAASPIKATFINPSYPGSEFWNNVTQFMQAAADDLGVELKVVYASQSSDIDRLEYVKLFAQECNAPTPPDVIVTHFRKGSAKQILDIGEKSGVKSFFFNTQVPSDERDVVGLPREKYKHWIGHMFPNDTLAGYDLAKLLIRVAEHKGLQNPDGNILLAGLSGNQHSVAAINRNQGLEQAVKETGRELSQIVFTKWKRERSKELSLKLMQRFPDINVFWAASDDIALGALDAVKQAGIKPGQKILVGGFDWRIQALEAIKAGEMTASGGGHFMEGGWAMVMLYDYFHGKDFASAGGQFESRLLMIDGANVESYLKHFSGKNWRQIDFKKFSKTYNPALTEYDFSLSKILQQLAQ